jgi:hypothetical protein
LNIHHFLWQSWLPFWKSGKIGKNLQLYSLWRYCLATKRQVTHSKIKSLSENIQKVFSHQKVVIHWGSSCW